MDELLSKKRKYENLKTNVTSVINKLNSAIENLEVPANKIKNSYIIDSVSVENNKLSVVKQNLINKKNYLVNNVLYSIKQELIEIKQQIESVG